MTYWEERAIESAKRMDGAISEYTSEMVQSFENAKKQLQSEINSFYGKYADENKITFAQAQKELSLAELRSFKGDLKEYEKLAKNSIGTYDLTVSNLSKKARITRLQALHIQCDTILQKLYQQQKVTIEEISKRLYIEQYYQKQFDVERYTGYQFNFAVPSLYVIKKVLAMPVNGVDISTSLWRQDVDTGFKIRQTLNEMFITGKPPQAFSQNLQKIIGRRDENGNLTGKKYEAYRLLYNESSFVTEQSALQAYKDDEVDEYEIIATLDFKTTPICQHEDGKHYPVKLAVTGVNYPPFHVNCRTTTGPYIGDLKGFSSTRMARSENGKSIRTKNVSYEKWKANVDKAGKSDIIKTQGFASKKLLDKHLDKHLKEYENFSSDAYVARAIELLNHPVDANVKGFTGSNSKVYRYDISNNDFAIKNKNGTIATLFKPEQGLTYWERQEKKYGSS